MNKLLTFPRSLLVALFGHISWVAPVWLESLGGHFKRHPKRYLGLFILLLVAISSYIYFQQLPQTPKLLATLSEIEPTPDYQDAKPSQLLVSFGYPGASADDEFIRDDNSTAVLDSSNSTEYSQTPKAIASVARIDLLDKIIESGISLKPHKEGSWRWLQDNQLVFTPKTDWPAGMQYQLEFSAQIFSPESELASYKYSFSTPALTLDFKNSQFYQDPLNNKIRKVVSTLHFSHPVDKASLESNISLTMRNQNGKAEAEKAFEYELLYSKNLRQVTVHSEPIKLPKNTNYMHISVAAGITSLLGGAATTEAKTTKVQVPDVYSFLKVESQLQILRNPKDQPEQILMLNFTDEMSQQQIVEHLQVFLLPKYGEPLGRNRWDGPRQVSQNVLMQSKPVAYKVVENPRETSKHYNLVIDIPENRTVYVRIAAGFSSVNQFVHRQQYDAIHGVSQYPKEIKIVGDGAILSYSGNHKLSVLTRGLSGLKYRVAQVKKNQLHHLISQTEGNIADPQFSSWNFDEKNLADIHTTIVPLRQQHPKRANYSSFDLSQYLTNGENRYGLFLVEIQGYDRSRKRVVYGAEERRLILISDLGVIVKNNANSTHELFVQSVTNGRAVSSASVELLARNGDKVFSGKTNQTGHLTIPNTNNLRDEKMPVVYLVRSGNDTSFIPYDRYSRRVELSRFDVGGVYSNQQTKQNLNSFVFTDRGIYRPGETINLGLITKTGQLQNVEDIPVELVIRGPRYNEIRVEKMLVGKKGLNDFQFKTAATSDTGDYTATLHLIRDNRRRGMEIGNVRFKVEEFQPDTMKITSQLVDVPNKGWTDQQKLKAKISLTNLFGSPAQNRNIVAKVNVQPIQFRFKEFSGYQFNQAKLESESSMSIDSSLPQQKTDDNGEVLLDIDVSRFTHGTYRLNLSVEGFEPSGGRSVFARSTALLSPFQSLIGFKSDGRLSYINKDSQRKIEFIAINQKLEKIALPQLTLATFEVQKVSSLVKQSNGTYQYQTITKQVELERKAFQVNQDSTNYLLNTTSPGDYVLVVNDPQNIPLAKLYYSVVGSANLAGKIDQSAELQLKLNKQDYKPGEMVEMSITAPYAGAGLITIETDRVLKYQWFKASKQSSIESIQLPNDIEGNGYINVTYVRDVSSTDIFTSPLSYAVEPFSIDRSQRRIDIELKTPEIARPGKAMSIEYQASQSAKMLIFAIDQGILQVANYHTPDPLGHYLQKRALGVETYQMLDLLLPDFSILQQVSAAGGGFAESSMAIAKNINPFRRKTDQPAVFWSGVVDASEKSQQLQFDIPNTFAGQLQVFAVAVADSAVGVSQASSIVRGPFVLSPNVLTHVAPGDEFDVTVGVANIIEGSGEQANVSIDIKVSDQLEILGSTQQTLAISEGDEAKSSFKLRAKSKLGSAEIMFTAKLGSEQLSRSASVSVRPATHFAAVFKSGFSDSGSQKLVDLRQTFSEFSERTVTASSNPLVVVDGLHNYLEHYPHGCTEQVVSKVFPLVGLMSHPAYAPHLGDVNAPFSVVINKLRERQKSDGGFAFWPSHGSSSSYPSIYVSHFLLEASEKGFAVPKDMLRAAQHYLAQVAANSSQQLSVLRNRANAIYLLSRMGVVTTNYLVDLEDDLKKLSQQKNSNGNKNKINWQKDILASYMAATYQILQKDGEAERLIEHYQLHTGQSPKDNPLANSDFHSPLALDAQHIYLLSKHFIKRARAIDAKRVHGFTEQIMAGDYNTISAAYSILALGAYGALTNSVEQDEKIVFRVTANDGKSTKELTHNDSAFAKANFPAATQQLEIASQQAFYYLTNQSGFDLAVSDQPIRQGMEIIREYLDNQGNPVSAFTQGQELTVKIKVRSLDQASVSNVAIVDLLPGGFEVIRSSVQRAASRWSADHVDIREDRVIFYGNVQSRIRELSYRVKPTASGQFSLPATAAQAMYDRSVRAVTAASKIIVKPSN
jgi:alpha-2-macroglobulin